jgi:hypothetical protein
MIVPLSVLSDVGDPRVGSGLSNGPAGLERLYTAHVTQGHLSLTVRRTGDTGIFTSPLVMRLAPGVSPNLSPRDPLPLERHAPISGEYGMTRLVSWEGRRLIADDRVEMLQKPMGLQN